MAKIKRIGILSCGKFFAIMGFFNGIFTVISYFILSKIANSVFLDYSNSLRAKFADLSGAQAASGAQAVSLPAMLPAYLLPSLNIWSIIGVMVASIVMGFVVGVMIAMNYDSISKIMGGLEIEIE